ncbi:MAG TPA: tRNA pseudouridine(38-40) synthase TruA [Flavobacteriales bacterium]|nr:tRNA pseudouridine(38-40) synthase TruA [Flavobacteriales bacterium]
MARYFIKLSYDGSNYHGWQIQANANTVQAEINKALSSVIGQRITCTGCGRTDTGVHAAEFYAHFDTKYVPHSSDLIYKINGCLPGDIAVHKLYPVGDQANSRFDAISRSYKYRIIMRKNVFSQSYSYYHYKQVDLSAMNSCSSLLLEHTDFSCFSKSKTQTKTNSCYITEAKWTANDQELEFRITANRFLRGMVRAIVGTMLDVGEGKISQEDFVKTLESMDRTQAGYSVPARGLFLDKVSYPDGYLKEEDKR